EELLLHTPLPVPGHGVLDLQLAVSSADDSGRRTLELHAGQQDGSWTRHATGVLAPADPLTVPEFGDWPPAGAVELTDLAPPGLRRCWRSGTDSYAELTPPPRDDTGFGLHPMLLDAALGLLAPGDDADVAGLRPFVYRGVSRFATGAIDVRARLSRPAPDQVAVVLAGHDRRPVLVIQSLELRPA